MAELALQIIILHIIAHARVAILEAIAKLISVYQIHAIMEELALHYLTRASLVLVQLIFMVIHANQILAYRVHV